MDFDEVETSFMETCLTLALEAEGMTAPNPMVGAVIIDKDGNPVGSGYHHEAGKKAKGSTIYVSLEPCCHFGKTPPCTDAIIESGIVKVVAAIKDPNSKVAGNGFKKLQESGIEVKYGLLEEKAIWVNRGFIKRVTTGLPWVTLKMATTLDGRIADRYGKSKWITSSVARKKVHELRAIADCVLTGANTARLDNPRLNARDVHAKKQPIRAVIDPHLSLDKDSHLLNCSESKTVVYCTDTESRKSLYQDCELISMQSEDGHISLEDVLKDMAERGMNNILVEAGSKLAGQFLLNGHVDEIYWFIAPKFLPDSNALSATSSDSPLTMENAIDFDLIESIALEKDTLIHLKRKYASK